MTGRPMSLLMIQCPQPWWSEFEPMPSMDALRAAVDYDDDLDGWITASDLRRWLDIFDTDDNSEMDLDEYVAFSMERYKVNATIAKIMFDLTDMSGDQKLSERDWEFQFKDDFALSLCDARRSLLDLARMATKFQGTQLTGKALRAAMQRKLQEEWGWYQQARGGDWGGPGRYGGRGPPRRAGKTRFTHDGCLAEGTCYRGEYTEAWGRPGAWMWWGMKDGQAAGYRPGNFMTQFPGSFPGGDSRAGMGVNMLPGMSSPLGGMTIPFFPGQSFLGVDNRSPFTQFQYPNLPAGSEANMGGGMVPQFFPFKRDIMVNTKSPVTSPMTAKRKVKAENYFSHYLQLFTPFAADKITKKDFNDGSISNSSPVTTDVSPNLPQDGNSFSTTKQNSLGNAARNQEVTSEEPMPPASEAPASSFGTDETKDGGDEFNGVEDETAREDQFPFMGYPVFIGFDPWFYGGAPAWGLVGRMKRKEGERIEPDQSIEGKDENETKTEINEDDNLLRSKRDASDESAEDKIKSEWMPMINQDTRDIGEDNIVNSTDFEDFDTLDRGIWPTLINPLSFRLSPIDLWAAMMLDNPMLNSGRWLEDTQNESMFEINETDASAHQWWLPEPWTAPDFTSPTSEGDEQQENAETSDGTSSGRDKRFANYPYSSFLYNPNYNMRMRMMAYMMRMRYFSQMFPRYPWYYWYRHINRNQPYSMWRWYWYRNPYMSNYWTNRGTGSAMWRRTAENGDASTDTRSKREANTPTRWKRWQDQGWYPEQSNRMWWDNWSNKWKDAWPDRFWKREAGEESAKRLRREIIDGNVREKRYNGNRWFPRRYGWTNWNRYNSWQSRWNSWSYMNPWYNNYWKRDTLPSGSGELNNPDQSRTKREANHGMKKKRYGMMWNSMSPYWYSPYSMWNWYPYNSMSGNYMWKRDTENDLKRSRNKRETDELDREKRYQMYSDTNSWNNLARQRQFQSRDWKMNPNRSQYPRMNSWSQFGNQMWKRDSSQRGEDIRAKRDAEATNKNKRFGMMGNRNWNRWYFPSNYWQASPWWDHYNGIPSFNHYKNQMWKRTTEDDSADGRTKRETDTSNRLKRYGMMFNSWAFYPSSYSPYAYPWNPFSSMSNWFNYGNQVWKRESDEEAEPRTQRDTVTLNRDKRYGMDGNFYGNRWSWQKNFPSHSWTGKYNRMYDWFNYGNQFWKRNDRKASKESRQKRDTENSNRDKRYGMWNFESPEWPWQNYFSFYNIFSNPYYGMRNQFWKRNAGELPSRSKTKRDTEDANRAKRYGMMSNFGSGYGNGWFFDNWNMHGRWYPYNYMDNWINSRNNMWKRDSENSDKHAEAREKSRTERDTESAERSKRYGMMGDYSRNWRLGNWWNQYNRMPGLNYYGYQMWKRGTKEAVKDDRSKRDTESAERDKRYGMMGDYSWNGMHRQWYYPSNNWQMGNWWNQYNKMPGWNYYGNQMWKRGTEEDEVDNISKRDIESAEKGKRSGMMGNSHWNRGPGQWYKPSSRWRMGSMWNNYNTMPGWNYYGNQMWKRGTEEGQEGRVKRDADNTERGKRYGMMGNYNWNGMYRQWYYPSNNWRMGQWWNQYNRMPGWNYYGNQMWKRGTEEDEVEDRAKRDTKSAERGKRYGMMGNSNWNRGPGQWYHPSSRWRMGHMWNNYNRMPGWNYYGNKMWKRGTEEGQESRTKRDTENAVRGKRNGMMGNYYWNRGPGQWYFPSSNWQMDQWWNNYNGMPGWNYYGNQMWKRGTEKGQESRTKRDTENAERGKRNGMMGNSYWNGMHGQWYYPSSNWQMGNMWNNYNRMPGWNFYGNQMWKRGTEEDLEDERSKRDTESSERDKRYSMMENYYWNRGPGQWYYPNRNWQMGHRWNNYNRMSKWNYYRNQMWKRGTEKDQESRAKRDTESAERGKRYGMMGDYHWNGMHRQWYYPSSNWRMGQWWNQYNRMPGWNYYGNQMWKRGAEEDQESRAKRDTESAERGKRYGMVGDYHWNGMHRQWYYPSNNWQMVQWWNQYNKMPGWNYYGNQMWKRDSKEDEMEDRSKRDTKSAERGKRYGMMGNSYWNRGPGQWYYPSSHWRMGHMWNNYNTMPGWNYYGNQMWKRDTEEDDVEDRSKRDTESAERGKRYGMMGNSYWNRGPGQWYYPSSRWRMDNWWNQYNRMPSWNYYGNQMWKRGSEEGQEGRVKRDTESAERGKRYGMIGNFNWYREPGQWYYPSNKWQMGHMWNNYNRMPGWNFYGNQMWKRGAEEDVEDERSKRDTESSERGKRYGMMENYYWNRGPGQWYYPNRNWRMGHKWNNYNRMSNWNYYRNQKWKRGTEKGPKSRAKRDTESAERGKRYGMMGDYHWDGMHRQWYYPSNNWQMGQWWNQYNRMPGLNYYGNQMWKRGAEEDQESRAKRDTESAERGKRYGMMGDYYWNGMHRQWYYPSNNWQMGNWWNQYNRMPGWNYYGNQMWKRRAQEDSEDDRSKRDTESSERGKRYSMMGNYYWNRGPGQWYYPNRNWRMGHRWNNYNRMPGWNYYGNQMWKRGAEEGQESRTKRDTENAERGKRYGMMGDYHWNGMYGQWYYPSSNWRMGQWWNQYNRMPGWNYYGNQMWKRRAQEGQESRAKRDTKSAERDKRYGMMGNYYWNGMYGQWYYPSSNWQMGQWWNQYNRMPGWNYYGNQMWKRGTEESEINDRTRRDTESAGRDKRYGMVGNFYLNMMPEQWYFPTHIWQMRQWWNQYNQMLGSNFMWKRHAGDNSEEVREKRNIQDVDTEEKYGGQGIPRIKRDVEDMKREKRYAMMWNFMPPYLNRWQWQWFSPFYYWYIPGWFSYNMRRAQMWKRGIQKDSEETRTRRSIDSNRPKRYGRMSDFISPFWNSRSSQWFSPYNNIPWQRTHRVNGMWKRSTQEAVEDQMTKRDDENLEREKRMGGMMWYRWPYQWNSPYNYWQMPGFFGDYGWRNYMWKREAEESLNKKRIKRETAESYGEKGDWNREEGIKADTNKRQFSYNKKPSPDSKSVNTEKSVWRSAKKNYGEESTWQRRLNQGDAKWQHGMNKNYGYSSNRWSDGAIPNSYQAKPSKWQPGATAGIRTSWQGTPSMFPNRGYNSMSGMRPSPLLNMMYRGRIGSMPQGYPLAQSYSDQWRGAVNEGENWPMDWSDNPPVSSYGFFGSGPFNFRYHRNTQDKRGAPDLTSTESVADLSEGSGRSNLRNKRWTEEQEGNIERSKRWSPYFNNYAYFNRYNRLRQLWAPWFFYSFCQNQPWRSQWRMFHYKRNATNSDKDGAFKTGSDQSSQWFDSEKEKRQGYGGTGYGPSWYFLSWMCPQALRMMQENYGMRRNFYPSYHRYNWYGNMRNPYFYYQQQQYRWRRSAPEEKRAADVNDFKENEDMRERRQWGNIWQTWRDGRGPQDCEEWIAPMTAWSPWRGWNMLRKTRQEATKANKNAQAYEEIYSRLKGTSQSPRENGYARNEYEDKEGIKVERASHRCRTWKGRKFDTPNMPMNMAMNNRMNFDRFSMNPWANNWMRDNRWGMRTRREASLHRTEEKMPLQTENNDRSKRWESGMWNPNPFWQWNPQSYVNNWPNYWYDMWM
ncbi:hypothetical protein PoB_002765600 [Plakobranchus ocellatus]|uniref:EF-hand domain-containing protein n=1 Tax=Plakobranchus ocellatus TaxID=259542 RepID=A0AAV3ZQ07_9GAST|nr:hypothetical protein PoB_002765600 [Plakobranchus ocellatus]